MSRFLQYFQNFPESFVNGVNSGSTDLAAEAFWKLVPDDTTEGLLRDKIDSTEFFYNNL